MKPAEKISFLSAFDQTPLEALVVSPEAGALGVVQFAHGMCENKERYLPFMEYLAENGFVCVISDHRGHGELAKERGDLGYFGKNGARAVVEDLYQVTDMVKLRHPTLPYFLFGHSMGSLAVRAYATRYEGALDGLFVCGSPSNNPARAAGRFLACMQGLLQGKKHRSKLLKILSFGPFYRAFPEDKCAWISSDKEVVRAYNASPLCGFSFTANGYVALFDLMKMAYDPRVKAVKSDMPVHFLSGVLDACRTSDKAFEQAVAAMKKRGYKTVTSVLYPNMRHEVLGEIGHEAVWQDVLDMLKKWSVRT